MNTPVSFPIAKLLKEKGFDEYCSFIWNEENLEEPYYYAENYQMICLRIHYYGDIPMVNNSYIEKYPTYVEKDEITEQVYELLTAPTIADVVMWLYEKHGIWIECLHRGDVGEFTFKISKLKKGWRTEPHYIHDKGFNSPTETYESAIEYVLKCCLSFARFCQ